MIYTDEQFEFLSNHVWAVLATGRRDGSPQQTMVGYTLDGEGTTEDDLGRKGLGPPNGANTNGKECGCG